MVAAFQGNPFSNLPPLAASVPQGLQGGTLPLNFTPTSYWTRGSNVPGPTPPPPAAPVTTPTGTTPSGTFDQFAAQRAAATAAPTFSGTPGGAPGGSVTPPQTLSFGAGMDNPQVAEMMRLYNEAAKFGYPGFQMPQFNPFAFLQAQGPYGSSGTQGGGGASSAGPGSPGMGGSNE